MHFKVEFNGKSEVYSFKGKTKFSIGRSPSCEIQILADGVSRKHVSIEEKDGDYFVVDHGSTNGSFIDEVKLKAGKAYPFNSFFPLRMGLSVYIFLLDETQV